MKERSIIIEGCDNSGKTTLIEKLSKHFGLEVVVSCRSIPVFEQVTWITEQIRRTEPVIHDRFTLISENVYGPVLRGGSKFDDLRGILTSFSNWLEIWEEVVEISNPILIYCRPNFEIIKKTFHERDQIEGADKNLDVLVSTYDRVINQLLLKRRSSFFVYDWVEDPEAKSLIKLLEKEI